MLAAASLLLLALFFALGTWQVVRLQWKLDLIWIFVFTFVYLMGVLP